MSLSCASGVRSVPVPLLPAALPAVPGHPSGAARVPAREDSGMHAGSRPGQRCGTRWGHSLTPLFPAAPGSLGLLAELSQGCAGALLPAVLSRCLSADEAAVGADCSRTLRWELSTDGCGAWLWLGVGTRGPL